MLDTDLVELLKGDTPVAVEPQAFDLIAYLATHCDHVIDRDELIANVWRGRIVSDAAISTRINAARRALDDDGRAQRVIKTVPRRGFRFVATVRTTVSANGGTRAPCFVIASPRDIALLHHVAHSESAQTGDNGSGVIVGRFERVGGRVRHSVGGEVHAVFADTESALDAALAAHQEIAAWSAGRPLANRVAWCIALGMSDEQAHVVLRHTAPGTLAISPGLHERLSNNTATPFVPLDSGEETPPAFVATLPGDARAERNRHPAPHCRGLDLPLPEKPSIIILPFTTLGGEGESDHLAIGIRLDVQTALVKISGMFVIAAGPANSYVGRDARAQQVGREMGVHYVLEGGVQRAGRRIRVTAQLTDTRDNQVIWAERYDRSLDDALEVQDEITRRVVTALDVKLVGGEQARVWRNTLRDPLALDTFYRGLMHFMRMDRDNLVVARTLFERVFELAPEVALGPTYMAICHWWEAVRGWGASRADALDQAGAWGERAVAMEDADGQAHGILAHVYVHRGRYDAALKTGSEGVAIRPLCANTNAFYASVLNYSGFHTEAIERMRSAIRYSPIYAPWWLDVLASAYLHARDHDRAVSVTREALRLNPQATDARLIGAVACIAGGWGSEARYLIEEALAEDSALTASTWSARQPYRDETLREGLTRALRDAGLPG